MITNKYMNVLCLLNVVYIVLDTQIILSKFIQYNKIIYRFGTVYQLNKNKHLKLYHYIQYEQ